MKKLLNNKDMKITKKNEVKSTCYNENKGSKNEKEAYIKFAVLKEEVKK